MAFCNGGKSGAYRVIQPTTWPAKLQESQSVRISSQVIKRILKYDLSWTILGLLLAHNAVWGDLPKSKTKHNNKKLTIEKLSQSGLRRWYTKFGQAHSNNERKITFSLILHFILDLWIYYGWRHQLEILIWTEKENQDLNRKSARLEKFCSIISIILQKIRW